MEVKRFQQAVFFFLFLVQNALFFLSKTSKDTDHMDKN